MALNPLFDMTDRYHSAESFGTRRRVPGSIHVIPNFLLYPEAHSKLSSSDQMKYPRISTPFWIA